MMMIHRLTGHAWTLLALIPLSISSITVAQVHKKTPTPVSVAPTSDSLVAVIVAFKEPPLFSEAARRSLIASPSTYQTSFDRFYADLAQWPAAASFRTIRPRQFYRTFFGVALTVRASVADRIRTLPYVAQVTPDYPVKAMTASSVPQVRAPQVWSTFNARGEGVTVGIIDTGIDYLHPAFGSGFGPGHKVVGGYDFVNDDPDPMDDNGHGTHVAGIVAADGGGIVGVAPNANLVALKVLNAYGSGAYSLSLAALEWASDPDGNGSPDDMIPILNMSLGNDFGSPDDPLAVGVNNAVSMGMTVVVAAGNNGFRVPVQGKEGNYFYDGAQTVGSPGSATLALTVGAVDSVNGLAPFTSKGPVPGSFNLKPELVAPGFDILSAVPGGGLERLSGTSMAAPHVAGVAALVKQLHPTYGPSELRSVLTGTARPLGGSAFEFGAGLVDAVRAVVTSTVMSVPVWSGGLSDPTVGTWNATIPVTVRNLSAQARTYQIAFDAAPAGVTLSAAPSSLTIGAGNSATTQLSLQVNNGAIPIVENDIRRFTGMMRVTGGDDTLLMPWAFVRSSVIDMEFDWPPSEILVAGENDGVMNGSRQLFWTSPQRARITGLGTGSYEFIAVMKPLNEAPRVIVREQVAFNGTSLGLNVLASEASLSLAYLGTDPSGSSLSSGVGSAKLLMLNAPNWGNWLVVGSRLNPDTIYISPLSTRYGVEAAQVRYDVAQSRTVSVAPFARLSGLVADQQLVNPGSYRWNDIRIRPDVGTDQLAVGMTLFHVNRSTPMDVLTGWASFIDTLDAGISNVTFRLALGSPPATRDVAVELVAIDPVDTSFAIRSPIITSTSDSLLLQLRQFATPVSPRYVHGSTITLGMSPSFPFIMTFINAFGPGSVQFSGDLRGPNRDWRMSDIRTASYTLYNEGNVVVASGLLGDPRAPIMTDAGRYMLRVQSDGSMLRARRTASTLDLQFDSRKTIADPLYVTGLSVRSAAGVTTDTLTHGEAGWLWFSGKVVNTETILPVADSTRVWYRRHGTAAWTPLVVEHVADVPNVDGRIARASLAPATGEDSSAVDLRIRLVHPEGHVTDLTLEPAFAVGNWSGEVPTEVVNPVEKAVPTAVSLAQNYPNPFNPATTVAFSLPRRTEVRLSVVDLLGRTVDVLVDEVREAGTHRMTWDARRHASGLYFLRLEAEGARQVRRMLLLR